MTIDFARPDSPADSPGDRPLTALTGRAQGAVHQVLDAAAPELGYRAIARLSGHLGAMWRAVYPCAGRQAGPGGQLRAACLSRARQVEWTLRRLECQLAGEVSGAGQPAAVTSAALARHLASYWPAERALVSWLEDQLGAEGRDRLAGDYRRALTRAPTRPHPRCPRSGPLSRAAFWLHGRWDRLLDGVDSRSGVGRDFLAAEEGAAAAAGG